MPSYAYVYVYIYIGGCNPEMMMKDCGCMKPTGSGTAHVSLHQCFVMKLLMRYGPKVTVWPCSF